MKSYVKITLTLEEVAHLEMVLRLDAANNHDNASGELAASLAYTLFLANLPERDVRVLAAAGDGKAQKEADTRGFAPSWWKAPLREWGEE